MPYPSWAVSRYRSLVDEYLIENPQRQNILIALICAGAFIANLDATIVNITLPVLSRDFPSAPAAFPGRSWPICFLKPASCCPWESSPT